MAFLRLLWNESRQDCIRLIVIDLFSGLVNAALAAIIIISAGAAASAARVADTRRPYLAYLYTDHVAQTSFYLVLFIIAIVAYLLSRRFVMIHTGRLAERIVAKTRIRIIDKIRKSNLAPVRAGRKISHLLSVTTKHHGAVRSASQIATGFSSVIMLFFTIGYIGYLSLPAFVLTVIAISAGVLMYMRRIKALTEETEKSTVKEREFLICLDHFLEGFKEVKMHEPRSQDLYENHFIKTVQEAEDVKNRTNQYFVQHVPYLVTRSSFSCWLSLYSFCRRTIRKSRQTSSQLQRLSFLSWVRFRTLLAPSRPLCEATLPSETSKRSKLPLTRRLAGFRWWRVRSFIRL